MPTGLFKAETAGPHETACDGPAGTRQRCGRSRTRRKVRHGADARASEAHNAGGEAFMALGPDTRWLFTAVDRVRTPPADFRHVEQNVRELDASPRTDHRRERRRTRSVSATSRWS
jgi:hypothetical protein